MNPTVKYCGVPEDDTLGNRIEQCRAHAGIMRYKLAAAFSNAGITDASLKKINSAKTVKELDSAIIKKLLPIMERLASRSECHHMFIAMGMACPARMIPEWARQDTG